MRIAIVVHGRFFAFDLARALIARRHDVVLFTNYPAWVVRRFGLPEDCVRSFRRHGVLSKLVSVIDPDSRFALDSIVSPLFGRWARDRVLREERRKGQFDRILSFSGVSEEILRHPALGKRCHIVRASAHIRTQAEILEAEQKRAGRRLDHPSSWIVSREVREYDLAPAIVVLSQFSFDSFIEQGVPAEKLRLMPLGADLYGFRASDDLVEARIRRIRAGEPLTVVYAGNMMYRKGMADMAKIVSELAGPRFRFRLVGRVLPEVKVLVDELAGKAEFLAKVPQNELPEFYASGDLFLFPTVEDGFPVVLAQAQASGLPLISTGHCSAPELVADGTGWIVPIRRPDLFVERLRWCDEHRDEVAQAVARLRTTFRSRVYDDVAADFERLCLPGYSTDGLRRGVAVADPVAGQVAPAPLVPAPLAPAPLKVAVVVHGRFHAFDLARALIARGLNVTVFTSYPFWVATRWGIPRARLRTFPVHGVLSRLAGPFRALADSSFDSWLNPLFSRWAVSRLQRERWDVIYSFSGVSEEILAEPALAGALRVLVRGSAHIRRQGEILRAEESRAGEKLDLPGSWIIEREEREYQAADLIFVLSSFAFESFRAAGIPAARLRILPLGTETRAFRPGREVIDARIARILSGQPLRVLYVGLISYRKGLADFEQIVSRCSPGLRFRTVGTVMREAGPVVLRIRDRVEIMGRRPQRELPEEYNAADVFIFPTLEDGFAVVLTQASAAGLPILATPNCCAPDILREGETGWVLPIRDPESFVRRLEWCNEHREELARMATTAWLAFRTRDWSDVAADFEELCRAAVAARPASALRDNTSMRPGVGKS